MEGDEGDVTLNFFFYDGSTNQDLVHVHAHFAGHIVNNGARNVEEFKNRLDFYFIQNQLPPNQEM